MIGVYTRVLWSPRAVVIDVRHLAQHCGSLCTPDECVYTIPSRHDTLSQCCFKVGPDPALKQHWFNVSCLPGAVY